MIDKTTLLAHGATKCLLIKNYLKIQTDNSNVSLSWHLIGWGYSMVMVEGWLGRGRYVGLQG